MSGDQDSFYIRRFDEVGSSKWSYRLVNDQGVAVDEEPRPTVLKRVDERGSVSCYAVFQSVGDARSFVFAYSTPEPADNLCRGVAKEKILPLLEDQEGARLVGLRDEEGNLIESYDGENWSSTEARFSV
ncbi:hypothetical protein CMI48_01575 [Candidatus Pacearchaeota archaeon]|nr:hypothetical protein [Candidatus Pacearchaeota archaeon]